MIKAQELRIGNYVNSVLTGEVIAVDWIAIKHVYDGNIQQPPYDMSSVYEPIPLTEEILLKCGFECVYKYYGYYTHIDLGGLFKLHDNNTLSYTIDSHDVLANPIQYLHQLQNLYYALTGEELEVKL